MQNVQQYRDEVEVLKNTLNKSATDLVNQRNELNNLKGRLKENQERMEKSNENHVSLRNQLFSLQDSNLSVEAKAKQVFTTNAVTRMGEQRKEQGKIT